MTGDLQPGDAIVVTSGQLRGSKGVLVSIDLVPTPSGARVSIATIRRPRAGETFLFATDVRPADAAEPEKRPLPSGFGS